MPPYSSNINHLMKFYLIPGMYHRKEQKGSTVSFHFIFKSSVKYPQLLAISRIG